MAGVNNIKYKMRPLAVKITSFCVSPFLSPVFPLLRSAYLLLFYRLFSQFHTVFVFLVIILNNSIWFFRIGSENPSYILVIWILKMHKVFSLKRSFITALFLSWDKSSEDLKAQKALCFQPCTLMLGQVAGEGGREEEQDRKRGSMIFAALSKSISHPHVSVTLSQGWFDND